MLADGREELQAAVAKWKSGTVWSSKLMKRGSLHSRIFGWVVFYQKRPLPGSVSALRVRPIETVPQDDRSGRTTQNPVRLKVAVVSNESRAVNEHRIRKFKLDGCRHFCFFLLRSHPQAGCGHLRLALDIAQAPAQHVVYIETLRCSFRSGRFGIRSILHTITSPPAQDWRRLDCRNDEGIVHAISNRAF